MSTLRLDARERGGESRSERHVPVLGDDKAAVLTCRLAWNHPLPDVDGIKRAAWACLLLFIDWFAAWLRERVRFS